MSLERGRLGGWVALAIVAVGWGLPPIVHAEVSDVATADRGGVQVQPTAIRIEPGGTLLIGPRAQQHFILTAQYGPDTLRDLTQDASWHSLDSRVAVVEQGLVRPRGNGTVQIEARHSGLAARVEIRVRDYQMPAPVSFHRETVAALAKAGCNAGSCHGAPSGKNGFRLSLWGHEPELDFETLTHEIYARRINILDPEQSLILLKPTMQIAHGGGRRLEKGGSLYEILRTWIAEGLNPDPPDRASLERIEVVPQRRILHRPADRQQLVVQGYFSDGTVRDVTHLARYQVSDENVAEVADDGKVQRVGRGEVAVLVHYLDKVANARLMFLEDVPGFVWSNPPENNYIDTHVFQKLHQLQILPSDLCTDAEFIRRAYLDAIGQLPTPEEVRLFLADSDPDKRRRLIDSLLQRPEYVTFWALRWGDLLRSNRQKVALPGIFKYQEWIERALRANVPLDQFVRELLVATGSCFDNPAANYYRAARDATDATETTAQLFLGIRMQCAKCHNHPFERWTQEEYYGLAAFFARVERKVGLEPDEEVVFVNRAGEITNPRTGQIVRPWLLLEGPAELEPGQDRRELFVDWLTSPENPFFAKAAVNRIWGYLMGRGIVEPIDDFRDSNPPSHEALLDALAADFVRSGYDQKHVIQLIMNSRVYQLSAKTNEFNAGDEMYFSHAKVRLLSAEQLLDAISQVTGVPEKFPGLPLGTLAMGLPDPYVDNPFLSVFGQPRREMACACERSSESSLSQALQMISGPVVHGKLRDDASRIKKHLDAGRSDAEIVEELYLWAVARPPTPEELDAARQHVTASDNRRRGLEDVGWALLNSKEFLFQH